MSRIDDLKKQNPELNISLMDLIAEADPSKTNKYIGFLLRWVKQQHSTASTEGMSVKKDILHLIIDEEQIDTLKRFEEHCVVNRIKNPDISKYNSFDEIEVAVDEADEILKTKELAKQVIKLYSDDDYLVVMPLSYEASKTYGANTKWCVTEDSTWTEYWGEYKLIYIIEKKNNVKHAVSMEYDNKANIQGWNQVDTEISVILLPLPDHIMGVIRKELSLPKYTTEFETLGDTKILTTEGVVNIEDATDDEIETFLKYFGENLSEEFTNKLKKKTSELGGVDSSKCVAIGKGSKMIIDYEWENDDDGLYRVYNEEILKNDLNDVVDGIGSSDIWKHITTDNEFLRKLLNIKK